jgi:hypothetical protein
MDITNTTMIVIAVVAALLIGGFLGVALGRRQRTKKLQQTFGPEYEHTLEELGDKQQAENELKARLEHVKALDIRPLSAEEIEDFSARWVETQAQFVDEPLVALQKADELISEVMEAKGYPVEDFEQQVADISVDYPELVIDYRGLHLMAVKDIEEDLSTEELRQAMVHGRALFENLIQRAENVKEVAVTEEAS